MKKVVLTAMLALALAACTSEAETPIDTNDVVEEIVEVKVEILTPEHVDANVPILLEAKVTQGDDVVNDADNVKFEVWQSGMRNAGTMLDGEFVGGGIFQAEMTFDEDGVYYMFAHTNARGMHVMPKQEITVGNPDMSKVLPDDSSIEMIHEDEQSDSDHSH